MHVERSLFMVCELLTRMSSFSRWSKSATLSPIRVKIPWLRPNTWSPLSHWHHGRLIFFNEGKAHSCFKWCWKESEKAQHSGRSFREQFSCLPWCTHGERGGDVLAPCGKESVSYGHLAPCNAWLQISAGQQFFISHVEEGLNFSTFFFSFGCQVIKSTAIFVPMVSINYPKKVPLTPPSTFSS